jgi:hypothetical protein
MTDVIVVHADMRDLADALCEQRFAALITDPPYRAEVHAKALSNGTAGAGPHARDLGFACIDDSLRAAVLRIADSVTRWSAIFSDIETAHLWRANRAEYVRTVPWVRWSQPQLSGDRPPSGCELVTLLHAPGSKSWSGPGSLTCFDTRSLRGKTKYPCEKPLDLMLSLVSSFSDAGETIVDPCAGSGTTGLAARLLGRDAVLVEQDESAAALAHRRANSPLTDRDTERCARWVEYQRAWLAGEAPDTAAGRARYERARADTERVAAERFR